MNASTPCSEPCSEARPQPFRALAGRLGSALLVVAALLLAPQAWAHQSSDAYLKLSAEGTGTALRVDLALRDLDLALNLDANGDGALHWGEVKAAWPLIDAYVQRHLVLAGCPLDHPTPALERRADGVYAVLAYRSACALPARPQLRYTVLADLDSTHRGLLQTPAGLQVLDPSQPAAVVNQTGSDATVGAAGATAGPEPATAVGSLTMLKEGVHHILTGYDHVLFLICLLLPAVMRRTPEGWQPVARLGQAVWPVVSIVTAFTLAHSVTLTLAALQWVMLPGWFIEPTIAVTIVLAAIDNLRPIFGGRRGLVTFLFGLVHGFGFAGVLAEMNLPTADFAWALLQFNLGLELGQLGIVLLVVSLLFLLRHRRLYPPVVIRGGSYVAILMGVLWLIERTTEVTLLPL